MAYDLGAVPVGAIIRTVWGNELRRFSDGWSPRSGAYWDRRTVYTDAEVRQNFNVERFLVVPTF